MKLMVYTVFDKAVGAYLRPFYARSKAEAVRSFSDAVNDPKGEFGKHANDFLLVELGSFDDVSGVFETFDPLRVISASECLDPDRQVELSLSHNRAM